MKNSHKNFPKIPGKGLYTEEAKRKRIEFIEHQNQCTIPRSPHSQLQSTKLKKNIENLIGSLEIPVGAAGPLQFEGDNVKGLIYAPFATTEGALVASISRGAKALTLSGAVKTRYINQRMVRTPVFSFYNIDQGIAFSKWVDDHFEVIKSIAHQYSSYAALKNISCTMIGSSVYVEFEYNTRDAAGQNMATSCTWHSILWIKEQIEGSFALKDMIIESVASSDKHSSQYNFVSGRGSRVMAEAHIPDSVLQTVLSTSSEKIVRAYQYFVNGHSYIGSSNINVNVANVIAAIFAATGQDIACTVESSTSHLHMEKRTDGIYVTLLLPSLVIGTIGGGTHLPHQRSYLEMMDCYGENKVKRFAEIICGFALALDLSTLASIESGHFAIAHEKMGRNRPVEWFKLEEFSISFFERALKKSINKALTVISVDESNVDLGSSIISELTSRKVNKSVGLFTHTITYILDNDEHKIEVISKVKPLDTEVIMMMNILASTSQKDLAAVYSLFKTKTGMLNCDIKEMELYSQQDERFVNNVPKIYHLYRDDERETRIIVMEYVKSAILRDTTDDTSLWTKEYIHIVLKGLAQLHAIWFQKEGELATKEYMGHVASYANMIEMTPLLYALNDNALKEHPWYNKQQAQTRSELIASLPKWWKSFEQLPKTLVHNDFNPRNLMLKKDNGLHLCVYDWELATIHLPQYDLVEFLIFVLQPGKFTWEDVLHYSEEYRKLLSQEVHQNLNIEDWMLGFKLCLKEYAVYRLGLYLMASVHRDYGFIRRIVSTTNQLLDMVKKIDS